MGKFTNLPVISPEKSVIQRTQKTCSTCGSTKPIEEFDKRKDTPDGRTYYCKDCHHEMQKRHYERTREHQIQKAMEWSKAHPERHRASDARYHSKLEVKERDRPKMAMYQRRHREKVKRNQAASKESYA